MREREIEGEGETTVESIKPTTWRCALLMTFVVIVTTGIGLGLWISLPTRLPEPFYALCVFAQAIIINLAASFDFFLFHPSISRSFSFCLLQPQASLALFRSPRLLICILSLALETATDNFVRTWSRVTRVFFASTCLFFFSICLSICFSFGFCFDSFSSACVCVINCGCAHAANSLDRSPVLPAEASDLRPETRDPRLETRGLRLTGTGGAGFQPAASPHFSSPSCSALTANWTFVFGFYF